MLTVNADAIRRAIVDGHYGIVGLDTVAPGRVRLSLSTHVKNEKLSVELETTEALAHELILSLASAKAQKTEQPAPVVEVDEIPADTPKKRRRGRPRIRTTTKPTIHVNPDGLLERRRIRGA